MAPHPSAADVWRSAVHLQRCDVDLLLQGAAPLLLLRQGHRDHHRIQLCLLCGPGENDFRGDPRCPVVGGDLAHPVRAAGPPRVHAPERRAGRRQERQIKTLQNKNAVTEQDHEAQGLDDHMQFDTSTNKYCKSDENDVQNNPSCVDGASLLGFAYVTFKGMG